jgi:hypothetical protein
MLSLTLNRWSFDWQLQIIHADVLFAINGDILIDEPLCIDVGLPALILSALQETKPNRWAPPDQWERMPFFICGCGDPECRGFSFVVSHHRDDELLTLTEVEERQHDIYRVVGEYTVPLADYQACVKQIGHQFLQFVRDLDYRPYYQDTVAVVALLLEQLDTRST